jgi:DnaK suppressor protein
VQLLNPKVLLKMDKRQLKNFRSQLESRKRTLQNSATRTEVEGRSMETGTSSDSADRADENYQKEFLFSLSANDRRLLRMVESALLRIEDGDFGQCVSCGNVIESKRLQAVPWASHCLACQETIESQEEQYRLAS